MDVRAENVTIENLLSRGKYFIPNYQREFDWGEEELSEFIENLYEVGRDERYFIGHMVFEGEFNGSEFNVIDGQQRITTITILLCVIRDLFFKLKEDNLGHATHDKFIYNKDKKGKLFVILNNEMPYPILQERVQNIEKDTSKQPEKSGEFKILEAYQRFYKEFQNFDADQLDILRDKIFNLEIIFVSVKESDDENKVDAHEIFMTLNATGKDLTPLDLIKSRIFKLYPVNINLKEPNDTWNEIIENTKGGKVDAKFQSKRSLRFLNNFFSYRYGKVSDKKLYKKFVNEVIKKKVSIKNFLKDLHKDSKVFKKISEPAITDWKRNEYSIYFSINAITNIFGVVVANPMLIAILHDYDKKTISKDFLIKTLNAIERFHFINNAIVSGRSSGLDFKYSKYAREIFSKETKEQKHRVIKEFIKSLLEKLPTKELFDASFNSKLHYLNSNSSQKRLVQYALEKLEYKKNPNSTLVSISIEHIYPQNAKSCNPKLDTDLIGNIANLILLDEVLNSSHRVGNNCYDKKKEVILKESHIVTTKELFKNNSKWSNKEVKTRRKKLINELYENVWK